MNLDGIDELKELAKGLKKIKRHVKNQEEWALKHLAKEIPLIFEKHIYDLVYNEYEPAEYQRTYHLVGGHGAKDERLEMSGDKKEYDFSIDEDSRDPVDGTTWREKADKLEDGYGRMFFKPGVEPFNRPFIDETQKALEFENKRTADGFEHSVNLLIERILKG